MKLVTVMAYMLLFLSLPVTPSTEITKPNLSDTECAMIHLKRADIGYKIILSELERDQKIYLYRAAEARLSQNAVRLMHAEDQESLSTEMSEENLGLERSLLELERKVVGANSVLEVLNGELKILDAEFLVNCNTVKEVSESIVQICEETGDVYATCRYVKNTVPSVPKL